MLRLRLTIEYHARTKKGQPPQSTTGVASKSENHVAARGPTVVLNGSAGIKPLLARITNGSVSAVLIQKRRFMSTNSAFSSSAEIVRGSSAIPQIGQKPGASRTICGCMGQVYSIFSFGALTVTGSSVIPHFGQEPGLSCRTSGCIGQVYSAL